MTTGEVLLFLFSSYFHASLHQDSLCHGQEDEYVSL